MKRYYRATTNSKRKTIFSNDMGVFSVFNIHGYFLTFRRVHSYIVNERTYILLISEKDNLDPYLSSYLGDIHFT